MRWGHIVMLSALLVTTVAASCNKEDCETGLSVGVGVASTCATVGSALCVATGWLTMGLSCGLGLACGVAAGVADASKEACRACGGGGGGAGVDAYRLSHQMKELSVTADKILDQTLKLGEEIQLTQIIALYATEISNYKKIRVIFNRLKKNAKGLVIRDVNQHSFEEAAINPITGVAASSDMIAQMMTKGHDLKRESIFKAVPETCKNKAKEYFLNVMMDCYLLESVARAMKGEPMDSTRVLRFKKQLIEVEDQYIKDCGCPAGLFKTSRQYGLPSALASLARSLPSGHSSSQGTYTGQPIPTFIMDDSTDRHTLKKISLLYSAAPFSPAKSAAAKATAEKYRMEEVALAEYLYTSGSSGDLRLHENHLFCEKKYRVSWHGQCVKDASARVLPFKAGAFVERTSYGCIASCKIHGFLLAGVQAKKECWCGNTPPPSTALTSDSECSMPCPGDPSVACGGAWRMNVYSTGGTLVLENGPKCEDQGRGSVKESECLHIGKAHGYGKGTLQTGSWPWAPYGCFVGDEQRDGNWRYNYFNHISGKPGRSIYRTICMEHQVDNP